MKKLVGLFLCPVLAYSAEVTNPKPYPSLEYWKSRAYGTTVHYVCIKPMHSLELVVAGSGKKKLSVMIDSFEKKEQKNIVAGINGSFFDTATGNVIGTLIYQNNYLERLDIGRACIGINGNAVSFGYYGEAYPPQFFYLLTAGPFLLAHGKNVALNAAGEEEFSTSMLGAHPRTAIGKKPDGSMVMLIAEGRMKNENGLRLEEIADILLGKGCNEAINLDGGGSSTLILSGEFYGKDKAENCVQNKPSDGDERAIANGIVVVE